MKKLLSGTKVAIVLVAVTILTLVFYTYMIARPISFGMPYRYESNYEGVTFEGRMTFYRDGTVRIYNTNYGEEIGGYYYYRDGYLFNLLATNEEQYEAEVEAINADFAAAIADLFYASRIDAFEQSITGPDQYEVVYVCRSAIVLAIAGGAVELALVSLTTLSLILGKRARGGERA